jgi:hypothetical protein
MENIVMNNIKVTYVQNVKKDIFNRVFSWMINIIILIEGECLKCRSNVLYYLKFFANGIIFIVFVAYNMKSTINSCDKIAKNEPDEL